MKGKRKLFVYLVTLATIFLIFVISIFLGVDFNGDNILAMMALISTLSGAFFGANFGEHWAEAKKNDKHD